MVRKLSHSEGGEREEERERGEKAGRKGEGMKEVVGAFPNGTHKARRAERQPKADGTQRLPPGQVPVLFLRPG